MIISNSTFIDSLSRVQHAARPTKKASWNDTFPFFVKLSFDSENGTLTLFCTNGSMFAKDTILVEKTKHDTEDFTACLYPYLLMEHFQKTNVNIDLRKKDELVFLRFGRAKVQMKSYENVTEGFDGYESKAKLSGGTNIAINSLALKNAMSLVSYLAVGDRDDTKKVMFRTRNGSLAIGATDGYRMACVNNLSPTTQDVSTALFREYAQKLLNVIQSEETNIILSFEKGMIKVVDGKFIAGFLTCSDGLDMWGFLDDNIPVPSIGTAIDLPIFASAVKLVQSFSENNEPALLEFFDDLISVSCVSQLGDTKWTMKPEYNVFHAGMIVKMNPDFLGQYLSYVKPQELKLFIAAPDKPVRLECERGSDFIFVAAPMG